MSCRLIVGRDEVHAVYEGGVGSGVPLVHKVRGQLEGYAAHQMGEAHNAVYLHHAQRCVDVARMNYLAGQG